MTDGEVASAQSSGLVKPAPPLPPSSPPPAPGSLRAVAGAREGGEGACVCVCVPAITGRRVNPFAERPAPLRPDAAGLICHLQKRNERLPPPTFPNG